MSEPDLSVASAFADWWREQREVANLAGALLRTVAMFYEFGRDSLPDRRRQRYGDIDYDWESRVNTTSATVSWRARLLGLLNSAYQPIAPEQFREIMSTLTLHLPDADFGPFTFIDIGSGKGRALLLATEFGFHRIVGIELLPELDRIARENVNAFNLQEGRAKIELIRGDAGSFDFPAEPAVIFLFNPLRPAVLRKFLENLERSLRAKPRLVFVVYANPISEQIFTSNPLLTKLGGDHQCLFFRSSGE